MEVQVFYFLVKTKQKRQERRISVYIQVRKHSPISRLDNVQIRRRQFEAAFEECLEAAVGPKDNLRGYQQGATLATHLSSA